MGVRDNIGVNVKRLRQAAGLTQEQVAAAAHIEQRFISEVEKGDRNITIDKLEKIAAALRTTVVVLVSEPSDEARKG